MTMRIVLMPLALVDDADIVIIFQISTLNTKSKEDQKRWYTIHFLYISFHSRSHVESLNFVSSGIATTHQL